MPDGDSISMYEISLLQSRADRSLRVFLSAAIKSFDITVMEWLLLSTVAENATKDKGVTMSFVARALNVTLPQVTALTSRMLKTELLQQKVSTKDRRSRTMQVTPSGEQLLADIDKKMDAVQDRWLADLTEEDITGYISTLRKLSKHQRN